MFLLKWLRRVFSLIGLAVSLAVWLLITAVVVWIIGGWYGYQTQQSPRTWGVSWSSKQAENFNLDNQDLDELLDRIPFKRLQLMSYWDLTEPKDGSYDFTDLDQQVTIAKSHNLKISLQLGLHQSRWPHCHSPAWTQNLDKAQFLRELRDYIAEIVKRYDQEINLVQYQLEPEIFKAENQTCPQRLARQDLEDLHAFVKTLTQKEIAISRSNNLPIWRQERPPAAAFGLELKPYPDSQGWLQSVTPFKPPSRWYSFSAGNLQLLHDQSQIFIRNLVAEPLSLQGEFASASFSDWRQADLQKRLDYAVKTRIPTIDLNGAEWWVWRSQEGDSRSLESVAATVSADF